MATESLEKKDAKRKGRNQGIAFGVLGALGAAFLYNKATGGKHVTDAVTAGASKAKKFVTDKVADFKKKKAAKEAASEE